MKTKIEPIAQKKIISYQDKIIQNFWQLPDNKFGLKPTNDYRNKFTYLLKNAESKIICIQTPEINDPELKSAIDLAVRQNNRIYLITNENPVFLKDFTGKILMRYGIKSTGTFILVNPANKNDSQGLFFNAPLTEASLLNPMYECIDLENPQIETLFHFFLYNFWHRTEYEIIDNFAAPQIVNKEDIPIFISEPTHTFVDTHFVLNEIQQMNERVHLITPVINPTCTLFDFDKYTNSQIRTSMTAINPQSVLTLAQKNNVIYAVQDTQILSSIILGQDKSYLFSSNNFTQEELIYAIPLKGPQKAKIQKKYTEFSFIFAEFTPKKTRNELKNKKIALLGRENEIIFIHPISTIDLKQVYPEQGKLIDKSTFQNYTPELNDDNCSCQIEYAWQITPFYLPEKAQKHKLYNTWNTYCTDFENFAKTIIKQIETAKEQQGKTLRDKISTIWQNFRRKHLSKETKFESKINEIQELLTFKEKLPYSPISERNKIIQQLNNIASEINFDVQEIEVEIKKTEIEEKIHQLNEQIKQKQEEFEQWDKEQQNIIQHKEAEQQSKINDLKQKLKNLKEDFAEWDKQEEENIKKQQKQKQEKLEVLLSEHGFKANELNKFKNELQQRIGKKNREKNPEDAQKAQEIFDKLREIEAINPQTNYNSEKQQKQNEISSIESELKELEKLNHTVKYEAEKKKKQSEITEIEIQIKQEQQKIDKLKEKSQTKGASSGLDEVLAVDRKEKEHKANYTLSDHIQPLPQIGELYQFSSNNYLCIEYWEDYETALAEIERFNAILCTKKS